jgi:hypothetical protein
MANDTASVRDSPSSSSEKLLDTGCFALETHVEEIALAMKQFPRAAAEVDSEQAQFLADVVLIAKSSRLQRCATCASL